VIRGFPRAPSAGRPGDPGLFPSGSVAGRVNAETTLLLGGGRALLMQLAHPMVAAGVADHSCFRGDPFARLWRTLNTTLTVSFGDTEQSRAAAARVTGVHRRVRGERDGCAYDALDPELLLWVHATLVDSALVTYERFVRPLSTPVCERYYEEMKRQAIALEVPEAALPPGLREFRTYVSDMAATLVVSDEARDLATEVVRPPVPLALASGTALMRLITVGLLPPRLRVAYGYAWSTGRERTLDAVAAAARLAVPLLPDGIRRWPHAREADRRLGHLRGAASSPIVVSTRGGEGGLRARERRGFSSRR